MTRLFPGAVKVTTIKLEDESIGIICPNGAGFCKKGACLDYNAAGFPVKCQWVEQDAIEEYQLVRDKLLILLETPIEYQGKEYTRQRDELLNKSTMLDGKYSRAARSLNLDIDVFQRSIERRLR